MKNKLSKFFKKADFLIGLNSLFLSIFFVYFYYKKSVGVSILVWSMIYLAIFGCIAIRVKKRIPVFSWFLGILLILLSYFVATLNNSFLVFWNLIAIAAIHYLLLVSNSLKIVRFEKILLGGFGYLKNFWTNTFDFFSRIMSFLNNNKMSQHQKQLTPIMRGVAISFPILLFFFYLFSASDLVYKSYFENILWAINPFRYDLFIPQLAIGFGVFCLTFGGFRAYFFEEIKILKTKVKGIDRSNIEAIVILVLTNILFVSFLVLQIQYLFGGQENISSYTYSEYARRGFNEMIVIGISVFVLVGAIVRYLRENLNGLLKLLIVILFGQLLVIFFSAMKRVNLYVDAYGYTTSRLYSWVFICLLVTLLVLTVFKTVFIQRRFYIKSVLIICLLFLLGLNVFSPERYIVEKNIDRFEEKAILDIHYLSTLSDDAINSLVRLNDFSLQRFEVIDQSRQLPVYQYRKWFDGSGKSVFRTFECTMIKRAEALEKRQDSRKWQSKKLSDKQNLEILEEMYEYDWEYYCADK